MVAWVRVYIRYSRAMHRARGTSPAGRLWLVLGRGRRAEKPAVIFMATSISPLLHPVKIRKFQTESCSPYLHINLLDVRITAQDPGRTNKQKWISSSTSNISTSTSRMPSGKATALWRAYLNGWTGYPLRAGSHGTERRNSAPWLTPGPPSANTATGRWISCCRTWGWKQTHNATVGVNPRR